MQRQRTTRECLRKSAVSLLTLFTPTLIHVNNYTECDKLGTTLTKPCQQQNDVLTFVRVISGYCLCFQCYPSTITMSPADMSTVLSYKRVRGRRRRDRSSWNELDPPHTPFKTDNPGSADSRHTLWCCLHRSKVMHAALQYLQRDKELWCHHCCL